MRSDLQLFKRIDLMAVRSKREDYLIQLPKDSFGSDKSSGSIDEFTVLLYHRCQHAHLQVRKMGVESFKPKTRTSL